MAINPQCHGNHPCLTTTFHQLWRGTLESGANIGDLLHIRITHSTAPSAYGKSTLSPRSESDRHSIGQIGRTTDILKGYVQEDEKRHRDDQSLVHPNECLDQAEVKGHAHILRHGNSSGRIACLVHTLSACIGSRAVHTSHNSGPLADGLMPCTSHANLQFRDIIQPAMTS